MTNFLVIAIALVGGYALRKQGKVPAGSPALLSAWILNIAMPAVVLLYVPRIAWSWTALFPLLAPFLVTGGAWVYSRLWARTTGWDRGTRTAVFLTTGLGNTSFVGFPLILAYYGAGALPPAILCDQASFFLLATAGIGSAAAYQASVTHRETSVARTIVRKIGSFPPLLTFPVALLWPPEWGLRQAEPVLMALGATLAPMALFSVGIQLSFSQARAGLGSLTIGLGYKLLLAPLLVLGVAAAFGLSGQAVKIAVFEAAMAPMITSAVVAAEYGANPRLATAMVGVGIPISLLTTAAWWWFLQGF